jgi:hypothetical protein
MTARQLKLCPCGRATDADCEWLRDPWAALARLPTLKERMPSWPHPGEGQSFPDALEVLQRRARAWNCLAYRDRNRPAWAMSETELLGGRSEFLTSDTIHFAPTPGFALPRKELRKKGRGRPRKWKGTDDGRILVTDDARILEELVEAGLKAKGLRRDSEKGVRKVIAAICKDAPAYLAALEIDVSTDDALRKAEDTLRKAYYAVSKISKNRRID